MKEIFLAIFLGISLITVGCSTSKGGNEAYNQAVNAIQRDPESASVQINRLSQYTYIWTQKDDVQKMIAYSKFLDKIVAKRNEWTTKGPDKVAHEYYDDIRKEPSNVSRMALAELLVDRQRPIETVKDLNREYNELSGKMPIDKKSPAYNLKVAIGKEISNLFTMTGNIEDKFDKIIYVLPPIEHHYNYRSDVDDLQDQIDDLKKQIDDLK